MLASPSLTLSSCTLALDAAARKFSYSKSHAMVTEQSKIKRLKSAALLQ